MMTATPEPKKRKLDRRLREQMERELNETRDTGGQLMRGTRTHKTGKEYDRKQVKRDLRNFKEMED